MPTHLVATALPVTALTQKAQSHASPQDALEMLTAALDSDAPDQVLKVLGPEAESLVRDIEPEQRSADWPLIHQGYLEGYRFVPCGDGRTGFERGKDDWPFRIDVVRAAAGWSFDIEGGRKEIVSRLIGLNELDVIDAMKAYDEIQEEFRAVDHDGDGLLEFTAHIISSDDNRDGLYWPGGESPVVDLVARASLDGFAENGADNAAQPYLGCYFRILDEQGPAAPGGKTSYLVNGQMLAVHALLAVPAVYGESGAYSFVVAENGVVLQADLGEKTLELAREMVAYDPDESWGPVE